MNTSILALSGWAQPHNALIPVVPEAVHVPYGEAASVEAVMALLAPYADADIAIGWSLGGALLMYAAAHNFIRPRWLVILSSPVQFVADSMFSHGLGRETFTHFQNNFLTNPHKTARNFTHLIADGEMHYKRVVDALHATPPVIYEPWTYWLKWLGMQRHDALPFQNLPPTLLIYGEADRIVPVAQGHYLHGLLPKSHMIVLPQCAHAPHLHDASLLQTFITEHTGYVFS